MLALEDAFDVEFRDTCLRRDTFQSVAAIRGALVSLGVNAAATLPTPPRGRRTKHQAVELWLQRVALMISNFVHPFVEASKSQATA
jgi:hypothetical protein